MTVFRRELPLSSVVGPAAEAACHIVPTRIPPDRTEIVQRVGISNFIFVGFLATPVSLPSRRAADGAVPR